MRRDGIQQLLLAALLVLSLTNPCHGLDADGTCQLLALVPFHNEWLKGSRYSDDFIDRWPSSVMAHYGYTYLAAALLAIRHFNERDTSVVPELATLSECTVHFPEPVVVNSAQTDTKSVLGILTGDSAAKKRRKLQHTQEYHQEVDLAESRGAAGKGKGRPKPDEETDAEDAECTLESLLPQWCAVLGPKGDRAYGHVSSLTSAFQIPQVAYAPMSDIFTGSACPSTVGLHMPSSGHAESILSWCAQAGRTHLAVVYAPPPHLHGIARSLAILGESGNGPVQVVIKEHAQGARIEDTVKAIKASGIKTILLALDTPEELRVFANVLQEENLLGPSSDPYTKDYVYILLEDTVSVDSVQDVFGFNQAGTPLDNLLNGAVVMSPISSCGIDERDDSFKRVWRAQNESFVEELNALTPIDVKTGQPFFTGHASFFQEQKAAHMAYYMYDAVMSVGFGACQHLQTQQAKAKQSALGEEELEQKTGEGETGRKLQENTEIDLLANTSTSQFQFDEQGYLMDDSSSLKETTLVDSILQSSFTGATGPVHFLTKPKHDDGPPPLKARAPSGTFVGSFNLRPTAAANNDFMIGDYRTYGSVLTAYLQMGTSSKNFSASEWTPVANETSHVYRSGSTQPPDTSIEVMDANYLTQWVQAVGLSLFGLALILTVGSMVCVIYLRKDAQMRAGQPQFLALLCFGAALMACSILTLSFDEGDGFSDESLDWFCVMTPWFFFVGHLLMFGSLYTKLWRVDKVMQFRRGQKISKKRVAAPLVIFLLVTMAILTAWSMIDPWRWERVVVQEAPLETYGSCSCEHFLAWFLSLTGVIVFGKTSAAVMAFRTADIPRQFSDTSSAYYAIATHLQAWFIGYPILVVLGSDSADAVYFGRVLIIWIFAVSGVSIVVVPKIYLCYYIRRHPELRSSNKGRVKVSGLSVTENSSMSEFSLDRSVNDYTVRGSRRTRY